MTRTIRLCVGLGVAALALAWSGETAPTSPGRLLASADAVIGRPATPVSYAGVARRTTAREGTAVYNPGGVGGPASGVGVLPGMGAGRPGVGVGGVNNRPGNRGGPVNRVGRR